MSWNSPIGWLSEPVSSWEEIPMFLKFKTFVSNLAIVNDSCERAVKTAADFATKYQHNQWRSPIYVKR
jgi:hypothetical protein